MALIYSLSYSRPHGAMTYVTVSCVPPPQEFVWVRQIAQFTISDDRLAVAVAKPFRPQAVAGKQTGEEVTSERHSAVTLVLRSHLEEDPQ